MGSNSKGREQEGCKVYVGNLERDGDEGELQREFRRFGPLRQVWVARNPPGFAFVIFQNSDDAEEAVRQLDGKMICGREVRVESSHGRSRWGSQGGRGRRDTGNRFGQRRSPPSERYGRDRDDGPRGRHPLEERYGDRDRRPAPRGGGGGGYYDDSYGGRERDFRDVYRSETCLLSL